MKIANEFTVHVPIDVAWKVLTDLEGIAPCLPGAQLTGVDGDVYAGKVKIKVGPVISEFAGTARFAEKDETAHRAVIDAKGRDARSAGNAAALITAQLRPDGESTVVTVDTDLKISGKLAQFGSGMIKEVSQKLLGQFVTALEAKIADDHHGPAAEPDATAASQNGRPSGADATGRTADADAAEPAAATGGSGTSVTEGSAQRASASVGKATPPVDAKTGDPATADAEASSDIAAARTVSGDESPLSETVTEEHPPTPLLRPGGASPLAAVEDAVSVPKRGFESTSEPEPLDLMALAGGSIRKRLAPVAIGVAVVVAAIIVWRVVR
jgi:carbon monoxide dehydrogenase subunit G